MATAALLYSGITVKMLVDKRLDAQLHTMFMVGYQPGAVAHPHDHPFEESYVMLEGEVDVVADGDRYTLRPGRRLLDRASAASTPSTRSTGNTVKWLETSAPGPPDRHSYRFERDWEYLASACRRGCRRDDAGAPQDSNASTGELYLALFRRMRLIRGFEDLIQSLFLRGEIYGTTHLYSGQEAVAVGFASVLGTADRVAATYRGHGHALALGVDPQALLDEMLGRSTGINGGLAGSMNVTSPRDRLIGCFGIVGGSIAAATGAGLALRRTGGVAVAYFGDGAMNQGYFFECLNFCRVLRLPVVLVCENNGYGEYTPFEAVTAGTVACARGGDGGAGGDGRRHERLERLATRRRARSSSARSGDGPVLRRGDHLPLRRPLAQRSGRLPAAGRARPLAPARPAARAPAAAGGRREWTRASSTRSRRRCTPSSRRWSGAASQRRSPSRGPPELKIAEFKA